MGAKPHFEVISIWEWLYDKVEKGQLTVKRPIEKTVVLTDSCYSSELGERFYEAVRGLHRQVGIKVIELANNRDQNLCCGMPSIVRNNFDVTQPARVAAKKIEQIAQSGVTDLYCYCPGCFMQLGGGASKIGVKTHYALEEILWALGDEYPVALRVRSKVQGKIFMQKLMSVMAGESQDH